MIVIRLAFTLVFVIAAVYGGIFIWSNVFAEPWTRDAHVRADIVLIAPQVSGPLVSVPVKNNQMVKAGDVIFEIEKTNFQLALEEAQANLDAANANAQMHRQQAQRLDKLKSEGSISVADVDIENSNLLAAAADAQVKQAEAALSRAEVDLTRTVVNAPVSGPVANLTADTGDYANIGAPLLAIVDSSSFRVDAFFLETKMERITVGAAARVRLMANGEVLNGTVRGISSGISVSEDDSASLLQAPQPAFQWVRLAQRVPVEIALDEAPRTLQLVSGMTATVIIEPPAGTAPLWRRLLHHAGRLFGVDLGNPADSGLETSSPAAAGG